MDLRLTKVLRVGGARLQASVDAYNVFNSGSAVNVNNTYGSSWQQPLTLVGPRLFKFGGQFDW